ncbi:Similar to DNA repair protein RAD51 homolog 2; acc. no. O35719 [Pyronema omphalodes CBS 100304]|uniref:Similar to DNA repair protein RAD51 homolog 2 acc. no. O35719 n=1 Tax=Pyronema omphalodes (strain CBS 100304) TaxID=1076935 RepID=U4L519_PYROM|nr:Similar to DNA repair protein RAD51 homolog 2; acc. no. O35719 [Pyronema omphalodes CBS 100304]
MAFPRPILASSLFESLNRSPIHSIPTSCTALDSILNGGIPYGSVISLSGPHAPTRTLMHVFAAYLVSDSVTEAMWIDTSGNFAGGTLKEVIEAKLQQQQRVDINKVLDKAQVGRVFDLTGIEETVREILVEHEKNQGAERVVEDSQAEDMEVEEQNGEIDHEGANPYSRRKTGVRLIVVDTITQPYASMVNKNQLEGL